MPTVAVFVPPTMPFMSADLNRFYRHGNYNSQAGRNIRRNLGTALGLGAGATANQIGQHPNFRRYYRKFLNLKAAGGLKPRNAHGQTKWPGTPGRNYATMSGPVVSRRNNTVKGRIASAIFSAIPGIRNRSGWIATGLTRPPVGGEWRPVLPHDIAKYITNLVKKLEIGQVRSNAPGALALAPRNRTGRVLALPRLGPSPFIAARQSPAKSASPPRRRSARHR